MLIPTLFAFSSLAWAEFDPDIDVQTSGTNVVQNLTAYEVRDGGGLVRGLIVVTGTQGSADWSTSDPNDPWVSDQMYWYWTPTPATTLGDICVESRAAMSWPTFPQLKVRATNITVSDLNVAGCTPAKASTNNQRDALEDFGYWGHDTSTLPSGATGTVQILSPDACDTGLHYEVKYSDGDGNNGGSPAKIGAACFDVIKEEFALFVKSEAPANTSWLTAYDTSGTVDRYTLELEDPENNHNGYEVSDDFFLFNIKSESWNGWYFGTAVRGLTSWDKMP